MAENAKAVLQRLADQFGAFVAEERQLQKRKPFPPIIDHELADWFLAAVNAYLAGEKPSLDHALGLKRGRGKPRAAKPSGKNYERAKKIFWMRWLGPAKSWTKIAAEFPDVDTRDLQRELKRYTPDILEDIQAEVEARMNRSDGIK